MQSLRSGWLIAGCLITLSFGCVGQATPRPAVAGRPTSFKECVAAGGKILKSYPAQCVTPDGDRFIDDAQVLKGRAERACEDLCGDGRCEEIVCMAVGCPCAESPSTCPSDCKD
jgi:hypothetical protein